MNNAAAYATACFPDTWHILKVKLRPFTLGHALLLQRLESPFLSGGRRPDGTDLALAVLVCSVPWERAARQAEGRILGWRMRWLRVPVENIWGGVRAFQDYLREAHDGPEFWVRDQGGQKSPLRAPFYQTLKLTQMTQFHKSEREALSTPLRLALWDHAALFESKGVIELLDEKQKDLISQVRRAQKTAQTAARAASQKNTDSTPKCS